jgi:thiamine-phosphate pyrophosphorylase
MSEDDPRLYLITPRLADGPAFAAAFIAALEAGDVACVLLRFAGTADAEAVAEYLVPLAQQRGVACLVEDPQLAARTGADGVHAVVPGEARDAALKAMKPKHIVGTSGGESRDDAMRAGETGVDYLAFGGPDVALTFPQIHERVAWWAEIFNLACVAYAHRLEEVAPLVAVGADFVALETAVWDDPRGPAAAVAEADRALAPRRIGA